MTKCTLDRDNRNLAKTEVDSPFKLIFRVYKVTQDLATGRYGLPLNIDPATDKTEGAIQNRQYPCNFCPRNQTCPNWELFRNQT